MLKCLNVKIGKKGFTLLEVVVAIFIITVGIVGALALISQTISSARISSQRLIAAYLAQEGIEIVRSIRDTNWLEGVVWNSGLGAGSWEADYTTQDLNDDYDGDFLNIDTNNGLYGYSSGTQTKFKRRIIISPEAADILKVTAEVFWEDKLLITVQEKLYDWR
ncbi:prepilin-type N-terminal cleavage/methylation domain-containing protein [Patescibacteria group bacterium]|nr:prepilin-type N-terminal cleavage/methylation domain-containing protein [Patescibacteria group bacterium]